MPHHSTHHHYHITRLSELKRLYWAHTIRALASEMTVIFIPIYLYGLHYSITEIMGYFLWFSVLWGVLQYPVMRFSNFIGFNRAMGISMIIQGIHILMLATISIYHWPLWLIAFVWALLVAMYWPNFRSCFAKSLLHKKIGPSVGISVALLLLAYGLAPVAGGIIATQFGIVALYVLAMIFFLAAAIPLFGGKETIKREPFELRTIKLRRVWKDLVANMGSEVDDSVGAILWPLFIFLLIPSYVGVGVLSSVSVIACMLIAFYVGHRELSKGARGYLNKGTLTVSLMNVFRLFTQSAGQIAGVNFVNGLGRALLTTSYDSRYYQNAEREPLLPYIYLMMMICAIGDALLFGILLLVSLIAPIEVVLAVGLILAVPAGYIIRLIRS